jgi:hypothetical protein
MRQRVFRDTWAGILDMQPAIGVGDMHVPVVGMSDRIVDQVRARWRVRTGSLLFAYWGPHRLPVRCPCRPGDPRAASVPSRSSPRVRQVRRPAPNLHVPASGAH